ncbi:YihY/virulence factor BrkB family protein [Verticiella sediminum]|uniref:YihY/virulence factor BrkB family protein n=1 Tax=Verticiella sediminum TaxID=1247510 RepID=A0A556AB44_9BURK|nr:YihY/virulence factor BrkB family protein [Verticiella sediminum]TSH90114.1 YihY/virulence factor BrkB family protein [Verticiella sediminum]
MQQPGWIGRIRNFGPLALFIDAGIRWVDKRASSKGAALALYMVFSLAPILLLVIAIGGWFYGEDAIRSELLAQIELYAGQRSADAIRTVLESTQYSSGGLIAAAISIGLLMFSSTTAFAELKSSLDEMWDAEDTATAGLRATAMSRVVAFGIVLTLSGFLLLSVVADAILAALQQRWAALFNETVFTFVARAISNAISFGVFVLLFAVILKMLPSVRIRWRDVFPGALLTALLFLLGKIGISLYLSQGTLVSSYGAAGSVIALILWIYFSALLFFYGAAFTREYWCRYGEGRRARLAAQRSSDSAHAEPPVAAPATETPATQDPDHPSYALADQPAAQKTQLTARP